MSKPRKNLPEKWRDHVFLILVANSNPALILAKGWRDLVSLCRAAEKHLPEEDEDSGAALLVGGALLGDVAGLLADASSWQRVTLPSIPYAGAFPCKAGPLYYLDCDPCDYVTGILCLGAIESFGNGPPARLIAVEDSNREAVIDSFFSPAEREEAQEDIARTLAELAETESQP